MDYTGIKHLHTAIAGLAIVLLFARGACLLWAPAVLQQRWMRLLPHVFVTLLLLTGLWLASQLGAGSPHAWLAAKVVGLAIYVVLTMVVMKRVGPGAPKLATFVAAVIVFAYIVSVAVTKSPAGFLGRL